LTSRARKATLLIGLLIALLAPTATAGPGGGQRSLPQDLGLSAEQRERLDALSARVRGLNRELGRRLEGRRRELEAVYQRFELDDVRSRRLRQEIHAIQGQLLELHNTFQIDLRKILTPEQFTRLQEARRRRHGPQWRRRREHGSPAPGVPAVGQPGASGT
jgi:Spy/CpxP family protein refolding chaperone